MVKYFQLPVTNHFTGKVLRSLHPVTKSLRESHFASCDWFCLDDVIYVNRFISAILKLVVPAHNCQNRFIVCTSCIF